MIYATLGTVIHATCNSEHLIPAFAGELESLYRKQSKRWKRGNTRRIKKLLKECREFIEKEYDPANEDYAETSGELIQELSSELEYFAPEYVTFGTLEGDGAEFGFWPDIESLKEGIREGEILAQDDSKRGESVTPPKGYTGLYAHISDHGNISLYRYTRGKERYLWGAV